MEQQTLTINTHQQMLYFINEFHRQPHITELIINYWFNRNLIITNTYPNIRTLIINGSENLRLIDIHIVGLEKLIIRNCNQLRDLSLGHSNITLRQQTIINCPELDLGDMALIGTELTSLHIENCQSTEIIILRNIRTLKTLILRNQQNLDDIFNLADEIQLLLTHNRLKSLHIDNCRLVANDLRFLQNNTSLTSLILTRSQLQSLDGIQNTNITYLNVSDNRINQFNFQNNTLELIELSDNRITNISNQFNGYPQLKYLYLDENQIHTVEHLPPSIKTLAIRDNPVTIIRNVDNLTNIKYVYVTNNPELRLYTENMTFTRALINWDTLMEEE